MFKKFLYKILLNEKGFAPLMIIIAVIGVLAFLAIAFSVPFKDGMLSSLFPKESSFAAYIFSDDFETGFQIDPNNQSKWYSKMEEPGSPNPATATTTIEQAAAMRGTSGLHIKNSQGTDGKVHDDNRLNKQLTPTDEIYGRFRIKLVSDVTGKAMRHIFAYASQIDSAYIASVAINSASTTTVNRLQLYTPTGVTDTGVSLKPDTEYCVELYINRHPQNGRLRVWVNGAEQPTVDKQNYNTGSVPISWVRFGSDGGDGAINTTTGLQSGTISDYYLDDFALNSTNRIGCGEVIGKKGPIRKNPSPVGSLPQDTTQTELRIETETPSSCKYYAADPQNIDARKEYAAITDALDSTNGLIHTKVLTGIGAGPNGTDYRYYVRCQDNATLQPNDDDAIIQFRIGIDKTIIKNLNLVPTYNSISVYSSFEADQNYLTQGKGNTATLFWKKDDGTDNWKQGMTMTLDRRTIVTGGNNSVVNPYKDQWRASVLGLAPNTAYRVKVEYTDPDGIDGGITSVEGAMVTKNENYPSNNQTYYVSPAGNDNNSGAESSPLRTIQKAVDKSVAGDKILVKAGEYSEQIYINAKNGEINNWITIKNADNGKVVLNGQNSLKNAFVAYKSNFIVISGFEIKDYADTNLLAVQGGGGAIRIHSSKNIIIDNNIITGYIWSGIRTQNSSIITIQNNQITRTRDTDALGNGHGISVWDNEPKIVNEGQFVIRNNIIRDITNLPRRTSQYWDGIGGGSNFDIEGFVSRDSDIFGNFIDGCTDDSIEADGGLMNVRVWDNTMVSNGHCFAGLSQAPTMVGPYYVFRNLIYRHTGYSHKEGQSSTGYKYNYNNTIVAGPKIPGTTPVGNGPTSSNPGVTNFISRNNIYMAGRYIIEWEHPNATEVKTFDMDYDSLFTTDPGRFIKWSGLSYSGATTTAAKFTAFKNFTKQELNGMVVDVRNEFIDFNNDNFKLKSDSQLKDKGQIILGFNDPNSAWPFTGTSPDIGALEIGAHYGPKLASEIGSTPATPVPTITNTGKKGDLDNNNKVDIFDFNTLLSNFGKSGNGLTGDIDNNGKVDIFDYNLLLTNFGR